MEKYFLAGDVGGTKTLLAYYDFNRNCKEPSYLQSYPSDEYPTLQLLVKNHIDKSQIRPEFISLGVAGPIIHGVAQITNLNWVVSEKELSDTCYSIPANFINDLASIAFSIPEFRDNDLEVINSGIPVEHGTIAVIAPGTGLGEGFMVWDGAGYRPYPSEGGHCDFSPNNLLECSLYKYLYKKYKHVSMERVCSGLGIPNLYMFLKKKKAALEPAWLRKELNKADDPTPIIVNYAMEGRNELCTLTLKLFIEILASEAGNLALKFMATGGVYLGGGIPRRIVDKLKSPIFMQNFINKGRLSEMLMGFPVNVIMRSDAALIGAARHGYELIKKGRVG